MKILRKREKRNNVKDDKNILREIASVLRKFGSKKCIEKSEILETKSPSGNTISLRNLELNASNIVCIASCFKKEGGPTSHNIKSISFSYNVLLGDSGAIALANNLPKSICEIGLVNCGINDLGGIQILKCINGLPNLKMICIEHNNFSEKLKLEFRKFNNNNPQVLVVV
jgi:hypothetical protein